MVRRLAGAQVLDRGDHVAVRTPANPTFWWGNFVLVGGPLGRGDAARALAAFDREHPRARHLAIGIDTRDGSIGDAAALEGAGATAAASCVLTARRLLAPARRSPARVRVLRGDEDWEQAVELRLAVARSEGNRSVSHRTFLAGTIEEARRLAADGRGWRFGAFVGERMCSGLGIVVDEHGLARYQTVETHPDHRGAGLASALVHEGGVHALRAGARRLVIVADSDGPAIRIYRALGFARRERQAQLWAAARTRESRPAPRLRE